MRCVNELEEMKIDGLGTIIIDGLGDLAEKLIMASGHSHTFCVAYQISLSLQKLLTFMKEKGYVKD